MSAPTLRTRRALVHAVNVSKSFHDNHVLRGIDLDVYRGQVVVLLGPSARARRPSSAASTSSRRSTGPDLRRWA